jgi:flagellar protein FliO/FliZ
MVKHALISGAKINLSFTKPTEQRTPLRRRAAVDWIDWARTMFALLATLALIVGIAYGARRLGMLQANGQAQRRLNVSETLMLDPRRRLVLVACDGREHLLLLGPGGDMVVSALDAPSAEQAA